MKAEKTKSKEQNGGDICCSFTLVVKRYKRENCELDDMRAIHSGSTCLVAKNSKAGGLYVHKSGRIVKGEFIRVAGSVRYPILIAKDEVHIRFENFRGVPYISTDQRIKQDIVSVIDYAPQEART